jgi:hypothetical protein
MTMNFLVSCNRILSRDEEMGHGLLTAFDLDLSYFTAKGRGGLAESQACGCAPNQVLQVPRIEASGGPPGNGFPVTQNRSAFSRRSGTHTPQAPDLSRAPSCQIAENFVAQEASST